MSFLLMDNFHEKIDLMVVLIKLYFCNEIKSEELHYMFDCILNDDMLIDQSKIPHEYEHSLSYLNEELAYFQPDQETRKESSFLYGEDKLKEVLAKFVDMVNKI